MRYLILISVFLAFAKASLAQNNPVQDHVDFKRINVAMKVDLNTEQVFLTEYAYFTVSQPVDSVFLDAKNVESLPWNRLQNEGKTLEARLEQREDRLVLYHKFKPSETYVWAMELQTQPDRTLYFIDTDGDGRKDQFWTQGQGKYTSSWLPSIDDYTDKIIFNIHYTHTDNQDGIFLANGKRQEVEAIGKHADYEMQRPMSSYLVAVAYGNFTKKDLRSDSDVPIEIYYDQKHEELVEASYRHTGAMFDFYEDKLIPYPWQVYRMATVKDFLYSGMENTTLTILDDQLMVLPGNEENSNFLTVNAHEMAHQWFGNLVTAAGDEHHWLHEGFATYFALLAEAEVTRKEVLYEQLFSKAEQLQAQNEISPKRLVAVDGGSLTYYDHGAWALYALHTIVGDAVFFKAVRNYLETYAFKTATTEDFLSIVRKESGLPLKTYASNWLYADSFPTVEAIQLMKQVPYLKEYLDLKALMPLSLKAKEENLTRYLKFPSQSFYVEEVVNQIAEESGPLRNRLLIAAFETGHPEVIQRMTALRNTPPQLNDEINKLLVSSIAKIRENAMQNRWLQSPIEQRKVVLKRVVQQPIHPFQEELQMSWYLLALNTEGFSQQEQLKFINELRNYTSESYGQEVRLTAFMYLLMIDGWSENNLRDLARATRHHSYRFWSEAVKFLDQVLEDEVYRNWYEQHLTDFEARVQKQLIKQMRS